MSASSRRRPRPDRATAALAVAIVALSISLTGLTPADAARAVKRALTADNAKKLNGVEVSRTPAAGKLLPLGADGAFPPSVVPPGPRGPRGETGPAGSPGRDGTTSARVVSRARVNLSRNAGVHLNVATMDGLAAGAYLVFFSAEGTLRVAGAGMYVVCDIRLNGQTVTTTKGIVGDAYGGTEAFATVTAIDRATPFDLSATCAPDQASGSLPGGPTVEEVRLTAVKVDRLTTATQ